MPDWKQEIGKRLAGLMLNPAREAEIVEELAQHLDDRYRELLSGGASADEARRTALEELSDDQLLAKGLRRVEQQAPEEAMVPGGGGGHNLLSGTWQDIRYGLRQLRRNPGFTIVAVLTLALGIGANTAIFSVVNAVLLMPLPFPHPDRLLQIWETNPRLGLERDTVSPYNFLDWRSQSRDFAAMATYEYHRFSYIGGKSPVSLDGCRVSADFFRVLGVHPLMGRDFLSNEERPGAKPVAIVSYAAWRDYFGHEESTVGKSIMLDGKPYTLIGVMPTGFKFPSPGIGIWTTPGFDLKKRSRGDRYLFAIGRLKPGVTLTGARSEADTIAHRLAQQYPDADRGSGILLVPLREEIVGNARFALLVLWGAVSLVLLIACANVANLLLSRGVIRRREFAVRSALGAARSRLVRQLLTESMLLAVAGGALGLIVARFAIVAVLHTTAIPRAHGISLDAQVLLFTALLSVLTGVIFGLAPAMAASSVDLNSTIKQADSSGAGWSSWRLRQVLILGEIALTFVLLVGAGLLIKSMWLLGRVDPGFDPQGVLTMRMSLPELAYPNGLDRAAEFKRVISRLAVLPGVDGVAGVNDLPFAGSRTGESFDIEGMPPSSPQDVRIAGYRTISSAYFKVMRIPLHKGREFTDADTQGAPGVAVINETLARRYWAHSDPLGHHLKVQGAICEIVGVVGDVKLQSLVARDRPQIYVPYTQAGPPPWMFFAVRTRVDPSMLIAPVRKAAAQAEPDEPIYAVETMNDRVASWMAPRRLNAVLLGTFAALALLLAAVGTYGVIAYTVFQRTHEIGIRMALGAERRDVLKMVVWQGLRLALIGMAIGIAGALALTRFLSSLLYGVKPTDPATFTVVSLVLIAVALAACYIPARRAARVDPMVALRYE